MLERAPQPPSPPGAIACSSSLLTRFGGERLTIGKMRVPLARRFGAAPTSSSRWRVAPDDGSTFGWGTTAPHDGSVLARRSRDGEQPAPPPPPPPAASCGEGLGRYAMLATSSLRYL